MTDSLYKSMGIPDSCQLGKRLYKKLFYDNAKLDTTDKKAFREDIDTITWLYTLKPSTIPIQPYEDEEREYREVALLHVNLRTRNRTARIAKTVHRAIPYPLLIVLAHKTARSISTAHKRFSHAEEGAIVAEDFLISEWIDLSELAPVQREFMSSLAIADLPHTNFFSFYRAIVDRLIALDCAHLNGEYRVESELGKCFERRKLLDACHELESRIRELRSTIRKETQFNRQVELNTKIKRLERLLNKKAKGL